MSPAGEVYLHGHHESVLRSHRWRTAENSAAYLLGSLEADMVLLDVGCGPGTITADLARRVSSGGVVGLDRSVEVLAPAGQAVLEAGVTNVSLACGDVYALPFGDASFDVVHCHQVLQHISDPVAALGEMRRVCRPGGLVAARDADYGAMAWYPDIPGLEDWRSLYREVARATGGQPDGGRHLMAWARRAGFATVSPSAGIWCYATPEDRAFWGELWAERIVASAFADQVKAHELATPADLQAMAAAWRRWAADPDGWFVVPNGEVLCRP